MYGPRDGRSLGRGLQAGVANSASTPNRSPAAPPALWWAGFAQGKRSVREVLNT